MKQTIKEKNILKFNRFRLIILLLFALNLAYISFEIYKLNFAPAPLDPNNVTQAEIIRIETLANYTLFFETSFLILLIIQMFMMFTKKFRPLLKSFIIVQSIFLTTLLVFNILVGMIFSIPIGNSTQNLLTPFTLVIFVFIYYLISIFQGLQVKKAAD